MLSPCQPEMGTKATVLGLYPTFLMKLDVSLIISSNRLSDHYKQRVRLEFKSIQAPESYLGSVHLVDGDDELPDTESVGEECVLTSLAFLGNTSFEFTETTGDDEDSTISLRGSGDHVFDKVTMSRGVNDLE